jgi:hypothetical protein
MIGVGSTENGPGTVRTKHTPVQTSNGKRLLG